MSQGNVNRKYKEKIKQEKRKLKTSKMKDAASLIFGSQE